MKQQPENELAKLMRLVEEGAVPEHTYRDAAERLLAGISLDVSEFIRGVEENPAEESTQLIQTPSCETSPPDPLTEGEDSDESTGLFLRPEFDDDGEIEDLSGVFETLLAEPKPSSPGRVTVATGERTGIFVKPLSPRVARISGTAVAVMPQAVREGRVAAWTSASAIPASLHNELDPSGPYTGDVTIPNRRRPTTSPLRAYNHLPMTTKTGGGDDPLDDMETNLIDLHGMRRGSEAANRPLTMSQRLSASAPPVRESEVGVTSLPTALSMAPSAEQLPTIEPPSTKREAPSVHRPALAKVKRSELEVPKVPPRPTPPAAEDALRGATPMTYIPMEKVNEDEEETVVDFDITNVKLPDDEPLELVMEDLDEVFSTVAPTPAIGVMPTHAAPQHAKLMPAPPILGSPTTPSPLTPFNHDDDAPTPPRGTSPTNGAPESVSTLLPSLEEPEHQQRLVAKALVRPMRPSGNVVSVSEESPWRRAALIAAALLILLLIVLALTR